MVIKLKKNLTTKHGKVTPAGTVLEVTPELGNELIAQEMAEPSAIHPANPPRIDPAIERQLEIARRKKAEQEISKDTSKH